MICANPVSRLLDHKNYRTVYFILLAANFKVVKAPMYVMCIRKFKTVGMIRL